MNDLHAPFHPTNRVLRSRGVCPKRVFFALCGVIGLGAIGYAGARGLRHERNIALRFSERIEAAQAPGEPVLVHNRLAALLLRWTASPALQRQMVVTSGVTLPAPATGLGEFIVVAAPSDVLLRRLHKQGFRLFPALTSIAGADATILGGARIYFAVPLNCRRPEYRNQFS